jgi:hypothetical protein
MDLVEPKSDEGHLGPGQNHDDHQESHRHPDEIAEPTWSARPPAAPAEPPSSGRQVRTRELAAGNVGHKKQTRDAP